METSTASRPDVVLAAAHSAVGAADGAADTVRANEIQGVPPVAAVGELHVEAGAGSARRPIWQTDTDLVGAKALFPN